MGWLTPAGNAATTDEYYLHLFSKKQSDLNWENPQVRQEVYTMMRWWLDKGIDGFRMDVINSISKVPGLPDAPVTSEARYQFPGECVFYGPRLLEFLREMQTEVLSKYDALTVGEMPLVTPKQAIELTHEETGVLNMVFQFEHMELDINDGPLGKWDFKPLVLSDLKRVMTRWQKELAGKGWNSLYLSNHDQPRALSRFGSDTQYRVESAKMLATFLHLLPGTPYIYQGEEIGMTNTRFKSIADYHDIEILNMYGEFVEDKGLDPQAVMQMIYAKGRDGARTPMQWDATSQAGFTTGTPWIKVNPNYTNINVVQALTDLDSVFYYYQKLIQLRQQHPIIVYGTYNLILEAHEQIYAFIRTLKDERLLVILNFTEDTPTFALPPEVQFSEKRLLISNYAVDSAEDIQVLLLRPFEARVYWLQAITNN